MLVELSVVSRSRSELIDITSDIDRAIGKAGQDEGVCVVYTPHTTAAITINENADPTVKTDIIHALDKMAPWADPAYMHMEGNSAAHLKSSLFGCSETLIIKEGRLLLGTWQGLFFCEFDGPRTRKVYIRISD
jgi:secondary thiamine-phosphate synthase enzyme